MNIGFGKFGKSIKFREKSWGIHGGDASPSILLASLAKSNPDDTFYLIGKSDFSRLDLKRKLELFPNKNVIDIWDYANESEHEYQHPADCIRKNNIKIDSCIFMSGPTGCISIPYKFRLLNSKKEDNMICKTMQFTEKYGAPIINYINETNIPYVTLCEDPRYFPLLARDLFYRPKITLGQYNDIKERKHHKDYVEQDVFMANVEVKYSGAETIFAIAEEPYNIDELVSKKKLFMNLYLNQGLGAGGLDRGPMVDEWILQNFNRNDIKIHGKWDSPWSEMDNFTSTGMSDLIDEMLATKYTLIIPIKAGWVTSKFWKMLHFGILPFMHPLYDTQSTIPVHDFLRVKTPEEFKKKIQILEDNPDKYEKLLRHTLKIFHDNIYNGKLLITNIYNSLYDVMDIDKEYEYKFDSLDIPISSFNTKVKITKLF